MLHRLNKCIKYPMYLNIGVSSTYGIWSKSKQGEKWKKLNQSSNSYCMTKRKAMRNMLRMFMFLHKVIKRQKNLKT